MGFSRQEYWSALPFPPSGHLPDPEIKLMSPAAPAVLQADSLPVSHPRSPGIILVNRQSWLICDILSLVHTQAAFVSYYFLCVCWPLCVCLIKLHFDISDLKDYNNKVQGTPIDPLSRFSCLFCLVCFILLYIYYDFYAFF